jgi:hypothetical protein
LVKAAIAIAMNSYGNLVACLKSACATCRSAWSFPSTVGEFKALAVSLHRLDSHLQPKGAQQSIARRINIGENRTLTRK